MPVSISNLEQTTLDDFLVYGTSSFELVIAAFGADSRSTHLISNLRRHSDSVIVGCDTVDSWGVTDISRFEKRHSAAVCTFDEICEKVRAKATSNVELKIPEIRLLVDVSCMGRVNMGKIFACIKDISLEIPVRLTIGYCLAKYIRPPDVRFPIIRRVAPVNATFSGWGAPVSLPVDAIVSLGYEEGKAIGAVEYLEPRNRWVFIPHSPEKRFLDQVQTHNNLLMNSAVGKTIDYDVMRPAETYYQLLSLVAGLVQESRPVLLSFGPKLFFAISLLVAMRIERASVWHVDGGDESPGASPQASENSVLLSCLLNSDNEASPEP
jgi:hypothetical protein